jgi:hypothetical protein
MDRKVKKSLIYWVIGLLAFIAFIGFIEFIELKISSRLKVNASIIGSKLKAQRANLNKLDRLPPGRILVNSANFFLI